MLKLVSQSVFTGLPVRQFISQRRGIVAQLYDNLAKFVDILYRENAAKNFDIRQLSIAIV